MQYQDLPQKELDKILVLYQGDANFTGWAQEILNFRESQAIDDATEELERYLTEEEETFIKENTKKETEVYLLTELKNYFNKLDPKSAEDFINRAKGRNTLVFDELLRSLAEKHGLLKQRKKTKKELIKILHNTINMTRRDATRYLDSIEL